MDLPGILLAGGPRLLRPNHTRAQTTHFSVNFKRNLILKVSRYLPVVGDRANSNIANDYD